MPNMKVNQLMILAINKQAGFNYQILEKFTAGLKLTGPEVKAIKLKHVSLTGSFVTIKNHHGPELWLKGLHVSAYQPAIQPGYIPTKDRKLLLNRAEISRLIGFIKSKGLTVVPLKIYTERSFIKVEIGVVKNRNQQDKREILKRRETERQIKKFIGP